MQRYRITQQDSAGNVQAVGVQEAFPGGPPVGSVIPADPGNTDYQAFLAWQAAGNEPDPMEG